MTFSHFFALFICLLYFLFLLYTIIGDFMGIGIDIVENQRIEKSISDYFLNFVLSKEELEIYNNKPSKKKQIEFLAGRFAVKEAIIKAMADVELPYRNELVILNDDNGKPFVKYKDYKILISISHEKKYSVGIAHLF